MVGIFGFAFVMFVLAPVLGTVMYKTYSGVKSLAHPEQLPYDERPAGRIHLFNGDYYFDSGPDNPYDHAELNWASGRIGCVLSTTLQKYPEYQFSVIGTVQVLKPESEKGLIAVLMDNEKIVASGLLTFGLISGAQKIVDRAIPEQTLHIH